VAARRLPDAGPEDGGPYRFLNRRLREMVPPDRSGLRVERPLARGEHVLPRPAPRGAGVFPGDGIGKPDRPVPAGKVSLVEPLRRPHLLPQGIPELLGQNGQPVLAALALPDRQLAHIEVDVLHPQPQGLQESETRTIQQARHHGGRPLQLRQNPPNLGAGEDDRESPGLHRPHHAIDVGQRDPEDVAVEEEEGGQRLVLRRGCHPARGGQVGEKGPDLVNAHLLRMPLAVVEHVPTNPSRVRLFGAAAEVPQTAGLPHLVEQPGSHGLASHRNAGERAKWNDLAHSMLPCYGGLRHVLQGAAEHSRVGKAEPMDEHSPEYHLWRTTWSRTAGRTGTSVNASI
jgi:hypothetical protein